MRMLFTIFLGSSLLFSCKTQNPGLAMCHKVDGELPYSKMENTGIKRCEKSTTRLSINVMTGPLEKKPCEPNYQSCVIMEIKMMGQSGNIAFFLYDKSQTEEVKSDTEKQLVPMIKLLFPSAEVEVKSYQD